MQVFNTAAALRQHLQHQDAIAFVPTMGNLHAGHLHLVEQARQQGACVVVSIFVNPLQFGANEDLASYPRTLEADLAKLQLAGADVVFTPSEVEMYPVPQSITVALPAMADDLCGAARPGHFGGVATVLLKLFNLVQPQTAVFGKKDFQQLWIVQTLVQQFNLPIRIIGAATVRETDGLALSSRNGYLNPAQRQEAPRLQRALALAMESVQQGRRDFAAIETQIQQYLTQLGWIVDYIAIRSAISLQPATDADQSLIVLGAARLGRTRLIDNIEFSPIIRDPSPRLF